MDNSVPVYLSIVTDKNTSEEQKEKERLYKDYVIEHRRNVKNAWTEMKNNSVVMDYLRTVAGFDRDILDYLITNHDNSKYGVDEWEPYRKNFFPLNLKEKFDNKNDFDRAWEHHYMSNFHHWNYWYKMNMVDSMTINFVVEMCCDWIAMSTKFGGDAYHWYLNQKDIVLGKKQIEWMTNILTKFYNIKE